MNAELGARAPSRLSLLPLWASLIWVSNRKGMKVSLGLPQEQLGEFLKVVKESYVLALSKRQSLLTNSGCLEFKILLP